MSPSNSIINFIRGYETCRLKAFMPTPNDKPTIGWGHTAGVKLGDVWTQDKADAVFASDLALFSAGVEKAIAVGGAPTSQNEFDAMVSLAYNIGMGNFLTSSVLKLHRVRDYAGAAEAFKLWNKQRNKRTGQMEVLDGLTKRRAAEAAIYAR